MKKLLQAVADRKRWTAVLLMLAAFTMAISLTSCDDDDDDDDSNDTSGGGTEPYYSVETNGTENSATSADASSSITGLTITGGTVTMSVSAVVGSTSSTYGIKVGGSSEYITCTPTNGLSSGDVISVTGFISSGDESKSATVKISYDGGSGTAGDDFANLNSSGANYSDGTPNTITFTVSDSAEYFTLVRNSGTTGSATTLYITAISVTSGN